MNGSNKLIVFIALSFLAACAQKAEQNPIISDLHVTPVGATTHSPGQIKKMSNPAANNAVTSEVSFLKSEILNREFLYGSDLQYSAIPDTQ